MNKLINNEKIKEDDKKLLNDKLNEFNYNQYDNKDDINNKFKSFVTLKDNIVKFLNANNSINENMKPGIKEIKEINDIIKDKYDYDITNTNTNHVNQNQNNPITNTNSNHVNQNKNNQSNLNNSDTQQKVKNILNDYNPFFNKQD